MFESVFITSLVGFFLVLTPLVFVHELGHYFAAIKSGVKVEAFSIGFGPELLGFFDSKKTRWKFSLIPLGGYVKMKGELINFSKKNDKISQEKGTFLEAGLLSRFLIVISGPLANLLFGLILIASLYVLNGRYVSTTIVNDVSMDKPAQVAGLLAGDKIISINNQQVNNFEEIKTIVENNPNISLNFKVTRKDVTYYFDIVPYENFDKKSNKMVGRIGITASPMVLKKLSFFEACQAGIYDTFKMTGQWINGLITMLTLNINKTDIIGPVGIAKISGSSLNNGLFSVIFLMAVLSINLGLINLLPIPGLDGGYIALFTYELIFGKPLSSSIQIILLKFGFIFLISLMIIITAFDLGF